MEQNKSINQIVKNKHTHIKSRLLHYQPDWPIEQLSACYGQ